MDRLRRRDLEHADGLARVGPGAGERQDPLARIVRDAHNGAALEGRPLHRVRMRRRRQRSRCGDRAEPRRRGERKRFAEHGASRVALSGRAPRERQRRRSGSCRTRSSQNSSRRWTCRRSPDSARSTPPRPYLAQLAAGKVNRSTLGADFNDHLTADREKTAAASLSRLGAITNVRIVGTAERGGMEVARIRFTAGTVAAAGSMYRTPDGKIQQFLIARQ